MQILVIGSGGREHAVIKALKKSPQVDALYCSRQRWHRRRRHLHPHQGNGYRGGGFAKEKAIDLVFVTPTTRWCWGWWTPGGGGNPGLWAAEKRRHPGGEQRSFQNLMKKYGIPTAAYETFDDPQKAIAYIENFNRYPIVIKADGLALGKGVLIAGSFGEAREAVKSIMEDKAFG